MLDTSMPPPAPAPAAGPHPDDEPRRAPSGPATWTAGGLLLAAAVLGLIAVFPDYYRGGRPLDAHADEVVQALVVVLGWLGAAALVLRHRAAAAQAGAWVAVGIAVAEGGLRLADLGQLTGATLAGPGLWLVTVAWAAGAAGAVVAAVACHRVGALGRLPRPQLAAATPAERLLGLAVGAAAVLSAVAFVPSWDRYLITSAVDPSFFATVTQGNALHNPGLAIAGNVVTAAALGVLPLVGLLWRPPRVGAALIAGTSVVLAAQVLSAAVQVLETPDPLQVLSPGDVRALAPQVSLHLTGWFDAELAALLVVAVLAAARLAGAHHHHHDAAAGGHDVAPLAPWGGGPQAGWGAVGPGPGATGPQAPAAPVAPGPWAAQAQGPWDPQGQGPWDPRGLGPGAQQGPGHGAPQGQGPWTPPGQGPWTPPAAGPDGGALGGPVGAPGPWPPPPAPPQEAGWGPRPADRTPSWGELPAPSWERPEHGGDR